MDWRAAPVLSADVHQRVDDTHLRGHGGTSGREQARGVGCSPASPCGTQDQVHATLRIGQISKTLASLWNGGTNRVLSC
jgi:hypothetical protein